MKQYGKKKTLSHAPGHAECGICHPTQKNTKKRARRSGKINEGISCRKCGIMMYDGEEVIGLRGEMLCEPCCLSSYEG
jgi:formylmethanofuran dehydrogenase subunit E